MLQMVHANFNVLVECFQELQWRSPESFPMIKANLFCSYLAPPHLKLATFMEEILGWRGRGEQIERSQMIELLMKMSIYYFKYVVSNRSVNRGEDDGDVPTSHPE
mmetsp:Transcript_38823/g.59022  ORF Transcript_38823/g.59022 Transcript_38823/m.59022 type:complete len:105 (+) Transcript_38823:73-387(+)|eukprot:CAMPEP_0170486792 /NCGR_PEP_ID=MMETSP0208-20121228/5724_1 /TAXON_ID=197538 /ORGANISM="Strombidium inclinatum, Strain S3" /LENGTH=104 /DNA_ID=CAMNT_0010760841 /DNA_START=169 /DNA_END=483 /DNA_ORIENTATION=-